MTDLLDDVLGSEPIDELPERPGLRNPVVMLATVVVAIVLIGFGVALVVTSAKSNRPAGAPLPTRQFSMNALPPLAAGDVIPPAIGPVPTSAPNNGRGTNETGAPGTSTSKRNSPGANSGAASSWTFDGADRLFIKSLGVNAPIVNEPSTNGDLTIPSDVKVVGRWIAGATVDSTHGTVLMAGHVNYVGRGMGPLPALVGPTGRSSCRHRPNGSPDHMADLGDAGGQQSSLAHVLIYPNRAPPTRNRDVRRPPSARVGWPWSFL